MAQQPSLPPRGGRAPFVLMVGAHLGVPPPPPPRPQNGPRTLTSGDVDRVRSS